MVKSPTILCDPNVDFKLTITRSRCYSYNGRLIESRMWSNECYYKTKRTSTLTGRVTFGYLIY